MKKQFLEKMLKLGISSQSATKACVTYATLVIEYALNEFCESKYAGRLPEYMFWKELNFQAGIYLDRNAKKKDFTGIGKRGLIQLDRPLSIMNGLGSVFN